MFDLLLCSFLSISISMIPYVYSNNDLVAVICPKLKSVPHLSIYGGGEKRSTFLFRFVGSVILVVN